ncbi:MAG: hypothetical protein NT007_05055 [Candidatus Kapabacteria bacterium]|nr:hypothetical protein [Candidatus Kapabacteria bacterium]
MKFKLLIIAGFAFCISYAYAQTSKNDTTGTQTMPKDSVQFFHDTISGGEEDFDSGMLDLNLFNNNSFDRRRSTIEASYGFVNPEFHKDVYKGEFSKTNSLDLKLGFTRYIKTQTDYTQKYSLSALSLSRHSQDFGKLDTSKTNIELWNFGLFSREGYAYKLGEDASIALTNGGFTGWSIMNYTGSPDSLDKKALDVFGDNLRFSKTTEAAVIVRVHKWVAVTGSFERQIIFPRFMFWYWCGSEIIEEIADTGLEKLIKPIFKNAPSIAPVVNFILKNGLKIGMDQLRHKYMNWPIKTAAPLTNDAVKIGLTFTF